MIERQDSGSSLADISRGRFLQQARTSEAPLAECGKSRLLLFVFFPIMMSVCLAPLCGCVYTGELAKENRKYADPVTEFAPHPRRYPKPLEGFCAGKTEVEAVTYDVYQFPGALHGDYRILEVLVPACERTMAGSESLGIVRETNRKLPSLGGAWLVRSRPPLPKHHVNAIPSDRRNWPMVAIAISKPNPLVVARALPPYDTAQSFGAKVELQWEARSHMTLLGQRMRYLYTIPLDVVIFPYFAYKLTMFLLVSCHTCYVV